MNFFDQLQDMMKQLPTGQMAQQVGVSDAQLQQAAQQLGPLVLGQLKRKKGDLGEDGIEQLLEASGGSEDVEKLIEAQTAGGAQSEPDVTVNGLFDQQTGDQAAAAMSQKLGIAGPVARKMLPMLVPVILGMLMKKGKEDTATPNRAKGITAILDRDGDGNVLDDVIGMVMGGGKKSGGFLSKILGMLFGRK